MWRAITFHEGQWIVPLRASQSTFSHLRETTTGPFVPTFRCEHRPRSGLKRSPLIRGITEAMQPTTCFDRRGTLAMKICVRDVCALEPRVKVEREPNPEAAHSL